ncbi:aminoglycoside phosphotransferase family protein [Paenibacillus albus]|uniref:Aminoglycoside phosphotransferase family protein n=1 Tax=Paenibacillus albus TaxID=2495582 RepID=A0A3Q8X6A0_9BACL|nr:aminoglycoside phosphotransferase family protein [Paenibacillus albus]AZN41341.1 aminoglycoside phosphotransferase family protein [Paenibacillus albus]
MGTLFHKEIFDWHSWSDHLRSVEEFRPIIGAIFERESLARGDELGLFTPATNAVFRAGSYVIKIFAPEEAGIASNVGYELEVRSTRRAHELGIRTPRIVAASYLQDKYLFPYIISEFIEGEVAGQAFKKYDLTKRMQFIEDLKSNMSRYNIKPDHAVDSAGIRIQALTNHRWQEFPPSVRSQVMSFIDELDLSNLVRVHGDINAKNVIVDRNDQLYMIDFAESSYAPYWYEYPPILFDLFDHDRAAILAFVGDAGHPDGAEMLFGALLLHDFGADYIREIYLRSTGKTVQEMSDIYELRDILEELLKG